VSRVLLLSEIFPPTTGGSGRWFWEIYRRMPLDRVAIAADDCAGAAEFDRSHNLLVHRLPLAMREWGVRSRSGLAGYWRTFHAVRRIIRAEGVSHVHCGRCLPEGWIAWLLKQACGVPYVAFVHGEELNTASVSREFRWMVRRVFRGAALVIANSRNTARMLSADWGVPAGQLHQLYPGVDTTRFVPAQRDAQVRSQLGWGERPVVLTVGRLQQRKGHDMLIRALRQIRQTVPNVLYAIAGDGDQRVALEQLVHQEAADGHVQFLGEVADDTLIRCYQQCDLFALPNREVAGDFEGFGMVLVEAQACGKPVIAGTSGGTAETMSVGATGQLVCCDGPDELARCVAELCSDAPRRAVMAAAARDWAVRQFDWTSLGQQAGRLLLPGTARRAGRRGECDPTVATSLCGT
jgi:phosphatidylinositol alpha-1,6-mannosyltransferase